ncbi:MAG: T9SS type A sorting domain-containing protein, partial [Crocinitomix sp.]|nr:T9SS type A sorting domain-containing protein [Crocinitomix sp.]
DENELADEIESGAAPVYLRHLVCESGDYYIRIHDYSNNESDPDLYNLTIDFDTAIVYSSITIETCDPYHSPSGIYTWTEEGIYTDTLFDSSICGDSIITVTITHPEIDVTVNQDLNILTAEMVGASYQWLDCDLDYAPIIGETGIVFTAEISGNYAVEITDSECIDTSNCFEVTISDVSLNEFKNTHIIKCYPNPATDLLSVELSEIPNSNYTIRIINLMGQVIYSENTGLQKQQIDLRTLPNGLLIIEIELLENSYHQIILHNH